MSTTVELDLQCDDQTWWPALCDLLGLPADTAWLGLDLEVDVEPAQDGGRDDPSWPAEAECTGRVWVWVPNGKPVPIPTGPLLDAVLDYAHEMAEEKALNDHRWAQEDMCDTLDDR